MAVREVFAGLPWWLKWVVLPIIAVFVFGGLIVGIVSFLIGLLFKVLIFVAVIGALLFVIRKFMSSKSSGDW